MSDKRGVCKALLAWMLSVICAHAGLSKLAAISMIESGDNDRAIGGAGEVSRFQIKPQVWRTYTRSMAYRNAAVATRVADRYLAYLESCFRRYAGREPTDFDRYVMWNAGFSYYRKRQFSPNRVHPVVRERAQRFENLRRMRLPLSEASQHNPVALELRSLDSIQD